MSLKSYKKAPIKIHSTPLIKEEVLLMPTQIKHTKISMWHVFGGMYNDFIEFLSISKIAGLIIPAALVVTGIAILHSQIWPEIEQQILASEGYYNQGTVPLVAGDYIEQRQLYLSNPGSAYFKDLAKEALDEKILKDDPISKNYQGRFSITIPSINLNRIPITANVDSGNQEVYDNVLKTTLAHMAGTGLPISNVENNIVVYGHSARGDYYERTQDPAGVFSRLQKVKIGDEIQVEMEGKIYNYKVSKTKIVQPHDTSIVNGTDNKRTITLFTCFPNGDPGKRFVVIARPV